MYMTRVLFQKANSGRRVTGDEGASHCVSGVIKSWNGGDQLSEDSMDRYRGHFMAGKIAVLFGMRGMLV